MAIEGLRELGARHVRLLCVVAAPEGVAFLQEAHAEAEVYTAALDRGLNDSKYILPGPGRLRGPAVRDLSPHHGAQLIGRPSDAVPRSSTNTSPSSKTLFLVRPSSARFRWKS